MGNRSAMARIYQIHSQIAAKRYPNVPILAEQLECSSRTVRRDLELMRDRLGAPLAYNRSRQGYCYTEEYDLPTIHLTAEELEAVWVAHQWLCNTKGTPYETAMRRAWSKLSIHLGGLGQSLEEWESIISVASSSTVAVPGSEQFYRQLETAAQKGVVAEIEYYSPASNETTVRQIEPKLLYLTSNCCYCVAYCRLREQLRTFAVNRIKRMRLTEERFSPTTDFDVQGYFRGSLGVMRGELIKLQIRFTPEQARYLDEQVYHSSQRLLTSDDSGAVYEFHLADNLETLRWVLSFGSSATVLSPDHFAERVRSELFSSLDFYNTLA
jgi:predicted DNA-binding transcriptional regulator YafY